jgi:hypothetical protein
MTWAEVCRVCRRTSEAMTWYRRTTNQGDVAQNNLGLKDSVPQPKRGSVLPLPMRWTRTVATLRLATANLLRQK